MRSRLHDCGIGGLFSLLFLSVVVGCSSGPKLPAYVAPDLPKEQVATIRGHGGTNVISVDQAEVRGSGVQMGNWGGNRVVLAPGRHRVVIRQSSSSSMSFSSASVPFEHDFLAGHTYRVGPQSLFDRDLELHDETTGEKFPLTD